MQRWPFIIFMIIAVTLRSITSYSADYAPIRILSIDGGGVRGMIPALVLEELQRQVGRPIHEIFDFIAGSSTGGIIAAAIASPHPTDKNQALHTPTDMVNLYITESKTIFSSSTAHFLKNLGGLIGPRYESKGLRQLLENSIGNTRLSDTLIPTLITGYHIEGESGIEFYSEEAKHFPLDKDCMMKDVALATAAAPAYFDSVDIEFLWGTLNNIADGGLYKHNPALLAYVNAKKLYPGRTIELYSLGTGRVNAESLDAQLKGRGLLQWLRPIFHHLHIGNCEMDSSVLEKLLNENGQQNYFRIDIEINKRHSDMDKTSDENLRYLYNKGKKLTQGAQFKRMVQRIKSDVAIEK